MIFECQKWDEICKSQKWDIIFVSKKFFLNMGYDFRIPKMGYGF